MLNERVEEFRLIGTMKEVIYNSSVKRIARMLAKNRNNKPVENTEWSDITKTLNNRQSEKKVAVYFWTPR